MAKSCILFIVLFAFAAIQFDSGRKSIKKSFQPPIQTKQYSSPDYLRANSSFAALPTILLAGAQKGGTSALAFWLHSLNENNTGVCQAAVFDGEPDWYKKEVHVSRHATKSYQLIC